MTKNAESSKQMGFCTQNIHITMIVPDILISNESYRNTRMAICPCIIFLTDIRYISPVWPNAPSFIADGKMEQKIK